MSSQVSAKKDKHHSHNNSNDNNHNNNNSSHDNDNDNDHHDDEQAVLQIAVQQCRSLVTVTPYRRPHPYKETLFLHKA